MRRELREWRKKGGEGLKYKETKRDYGELCNRKKRKENEEWERKAREAKRENEVWEIINRDRKRRRKVNEGIEREKWKEYFARLLGGVEGRVIGRERRIGVKEKEKELGWNDTKRDKETEESESGWDGRGPWGGMEIWRRGCREMVVEFLQ